MMRKISPLTKFKALTWFTVGVSALLSFQNCSGVNFAPAPGNENVVLGDPDHLYADITVGRAAMPDLKMVFIVDNSYTMTANQVNLSQSFANMLSQQNSTNLTPFNTTAYLFNTAQLSLGATSSKLPTLANLQIPYAELQNMVAQPGFNLAQFLATNRPPAPDELSGVIPGDTLGYNVEHLASTGTNTYDYKFKPMPVLNFSASGSLEKGIYKPMAVGADAMVADFQARLALLNNLRSANDYPEVSDSESGMCAVARILNDHADYFTAGDVPAFVLVTDENEANVAGDKCIESYQTFTGSEDLVKGYCEERKTTIAGDYPVVTPASCTLSYKNAYDVKYTYTVPATKVDYFVRTTESPRTKISYYKSTGYKAYKSKITYDVVDTIQYKRTSVKFYLTECEVRDGVVVEETCHPVLQPTAYVDGDVTGGDCVAVAKSINDKALWGTQVSTLQQPVCEIAEPRALTAGEACETSNSNCVYTYKSANQTVWGRYLTAEECEGRGESIAQAWVGDGHAVTCEVVETINPTSGICPADATGCEQGVASAVTTVDGDYTTSFDVCQRQAKTLGAAYVTNDYPAVCVVDANKITYCDPTNPATLVCSRTANVEGVYGVCLDFAKNKKSSMPGIILDDTAYAPVCASGTDITKTPITRVNFNAPILASGPLLAVNAACTQSVLDGLFIAAPTLPRTGGCKINAIKVASSKIIKGALTCDQVKINFSSSNFVAQLTHVENPEVTSITKMTKVVDQDIACSTPCVGTGFCTATAAVPNPNVSGNISDYLKSIYNSSLVCSVSGIVKSKINNLSFTDIRSDVMSEACPKSSSGVMRYAVQEGAIYHSIGSKSSFVSGTRLSGTNNVPAMSLSQYIQDKSSEVFGVDHTIFATFVRQPQDGTGKGGSLGTAYEALADSMNGKKHSVMLNDYSPALVNLSQILKSRLVRSMIVPNLSPSQKIVNVWVRRGSAPWTQIDKQMWGQAGSTLTLDKSIDIELDDRVKVEFY